jgi:hypothetical protein
MAVANRPTKTAGPYVAMRFDIEPPQGVNPQYSTPDICTPIARMFGGNKLQVWQA